MGVDPGETHLVESVITCNFALKRILKVFDFKDIEIEQLYLKPPAKLPP